jgi:hypothetical protein
VKRAARKAAARKTVKRAARKAAARKTRALAPHRSRTHVPRSRRLSELTSPERRDRIRDAVGGVRRRSRVRMGPAGFELCRDLTVLGLAEFESSGVWANSFAVAHEFAWALPDSNLGRTCSLTSVAVRDLPASNPAT